ncbi:hypothetical protein ACIQ4I_04755 [Rummeliibacillus sp. NPDC094406]|uniref:hypothetical protein n=1 Tax=Rummeliibacillus sp. NPDC094406 TaxID=3364511 RepID=UPI00381AEDF0
MKKITDERLVLRNLQNTRIVYIVQTFGILCILGYELFTNGIEAMHDNPVWLVFMISGIVAAYLSMSISVEHENKIRNPKKSFIFSTLIILSISVLVAYLVTITPNSGLSQGTLIGVILLICFLIPNVYIYRLRMKQLIDLDD